MKAFIVYPTYALIDSKTIVQLYGRLENGQSFVTLNTLEPYFFIQEKDEKEAKKQLKEIKTEKTALTTFQGEKVVKITAQNHIELNKISSELHKADISTFEADIKPHNRFIMDNDLFGSIDIEGEYESSERIDRVYKEPKVAPSSWKPNLKIISVDTESDKNSKELFCIGLYSENYKKNFIVSNKKLDNAVSCKNEEECLEKFKEEIILQDPDIVTGWNIIDFDLKFLQELFKKYKISFDLGRSTEQASLRIESSFMKSSSADIPGRLVLDGMNLIRDPFLKEAPTIKKAEFESYSLEDVSQELLGECKLIRGNDRHKEIEKLYKKNQQKLVDYNLVDCELAYKIVKETEIIPLAIERSQLTGMPLDRITASISSFDSLYIRETRKKGFVSPSTVFGNKETKLKGGFVFPAQAGIYHNVLVFDFKSLYPSVIKTFNIDPASFLGTKKEKDAIETPNKVYFKNSQGILPEIIGKLHEAREKSKKEKRELASYAIKTIMNSFWGVLASPNCRYFNFDMASSITAFARWAIQTTAKKIEEMDYRVIYGDTDSAFIETGLGKEPANQKGKEIEEFINQFYKNYIKEQFRRESFLELQFQKQYLSMMIPKIRSQQKSGEEEKEVAAKKRYAGLIEQKGKEELELVGLEAIRGDWTDAAQEFQRELLLKTFHKEPVEPFIKSYIKKIREGKLDNKLIYKKSIRKALDEYTKTTPPHVKAARLLDSLDSNIIQYYITKAGPEPIQKLKHKIDYEHYIEKQIKPIANQVLFLLGKDFDELSKDHKQATLF